MKYIELTEEHFSHDAKETYAIVPKNYICSFDIRHDKRGFINTPSSMYSLSEKGVEHVKKVLDL